jgi:hypothetical protein
VPFRHRWPPLATDDERLNVDVDGDVGGERRRWGLKLSVESGLLDEIVLDKICNGWESIYKWPFYWWYIYTEKWIWQTLLFICNHVHSLEILSRNLRPKYQCSRRPIVWQTRENNVWPFAVA